MNAAESKTLMTSGPIWKKIIMFALPLFLGNLFQQLYNTADSLIVGNFLDSNALAAVSWPALSLPPRYLSGWERPRMCCPSLLHISAFTLQVPWDLLCIMYLWAYCSL